MAIISILQLLLGTYVVYQVGVFIYNVWFHPLARFPGPILRKGFHFVEYWDVLRGTQVRSLTALHEKYGDVVRVRPDHLSFCTAGAWKDIYGKNQGEGQLRKDPVLYEVGQKDRNDIVYCNDADHTRMRRLLSHAFSDAALRQQEVILTGYFEKFVSALQSRIQPTKDSKEGIGILDLTRWYNFLTFDIIGDLCYDESFGQLESGEFHEWTANLFNAVSYSRFVSLAAFYEPLLTILIWAMSAFPSVAKAKLVFERYTSEKVEKRLASKTDRQDFMSYILRHNDERGMTEKEITQTTGALVVAGSETTATALSGLTYLLLKSPDKYEKVKKEVRDAFASADEITLLSTSKLPYLHACLEEALRMYPPVPIALNRRTGMGTIIDGVPVPENTAIGISQYVMNYKSQYFANPKSFVPERWLANPPDEYKYDNKDALQPFSTGPRNCIGKNLAYNEMRSIMARMLWHFDMELVEDEKNWLDQLVYFLWHKQPLDVKLKNRRLKST